MDAEYRERLLSYRAAMSLATEMLNEGILTPKEYAEIDRIIANRYGLSLGSICCRNPLIIQGSRGNIRQTEGG